MNQTTVRRFSALLSLGDSQMQKIDFKKPHGTITPPWLGPGMNRAALYEQDGKHYDAQGVLVEAGQPAPIKPVPPASETVSTPETVSKTVSAPEIHTPQSLLDSADTMPFQTWKKHAKKILGPECPGSKAQIIIVLGKAIAGYQDKKAKVQEPAKPAVKKSSVDLKAWALGQREYVFGELQKAIRADHSRQVATRVDALDFLIEVGVVEASQARQDLRK